MMLRALLLSNRRIAALPTKVQFVMVLLWIVDVWVLKRTTARPFWSNELLETSTLETAFEASVLLTSMPASSRNESALVACQKKSGSTWWWISTVNVMSGLIYAGREDSAG